MPRIEPRDLVTQIQEQVAQHWTTAEQEQFKELLRDHTTMSSYDEGYDDGCDYSNDPEDEDEDDQ